MEDILVIDRYLYIYCTQNDGAIKTIVKKLPCFSYVKEFIVPVISWKSHLFVLHVI